jgi:hypothetical protein
MTEPGHGIDQKMEDSTRQMSMNLEHPLLLLPMKLTFLMFVPLEKDHLTWEIPLEPTLTTLVILIKASVNRL